MQPIMAQLSPACRAHTIVTDVGSTKRDVVAYARQHLPDHLAHFVPAHPIAGAEKSGAAAACADLFRGRNVVLTPLPENDAQAVSRVADMWQTCGAIVST